MFPNTEKRCLPEVTDVQAPCSDPYISICVLKCHTVPYKWKEQCDDRKYITLYKKRKTWPNFSMVSVLRNDL